MSIYTTEDRFRALGMKPPDLSFLRKPVPPSQWWGPESLYNTRTLVGNWYEDRRAYKLLCPRFTGESIQHTDYTPPCPTKSRCIPPPEYALKLKDAGEGISLLRNTEDYCDYLSNYTTTYDLMHNWEVRRAGCQPVPWRKWKLIRDASWVPIRDNTIPFGNLTQIGYRKSGQVPMLPNDWDVYANNPSTYGNDFGKPKYPDHYVHCRRTPSKEIRKETEEMTYIKNPLYENASCYKCSKEHINPADTSCSCVCHAIDAALREPSKRSRVQVPHNSPRFGHMIQASRLKQKPGMQTLWSPDGIFPYRTLKHPPHIRNSYTKDGDCDRDKDCAGWTMSQDRSPFKKPDVCTDYAGDVKQD